LRTRQSRVSENISTAENSFALADFSIYSIAPRAARYVAEFGRIFNLGFDDYLAASKIGE
jgi:hypothetical protein